MTLKTKRAIQFFHVLVFIFSLNITVFANTPIEKLAIKGNASALLSATENIQTVQIANSALAFYLASGLIIVSYGVYLLYRQRNRFLIKENL